MRKLFSLPLYISGALFFCSLFARSQGIYQVSTDEKISRSSLIVEGKVTGKRSYWNPSHTMIYTSNQVEVYKVFKGSLQKNVIEVITVGGVVGDHYIHASHQLHLDKDDIGVFFCKNNADKTFDVYSSSQGFLKYDLFTKKAFAPFVEYDDIVKRLYPELNNKIGQRIQVKNPTFSVEKISRDLMIQNNSVLAPTISGFTPAMVHAGALLDPTNNILTINGSDFGTASGSAAVLFSHADYAPGTQTVDIGFDNKFIISWSNTQIKVRVPAQAGTGPVKVRTSDGAVTVSDAELNVLFSILNTEDFGEPYGVKQFNLGNMNGNGGYSIKYSTNTANSGVNINASPAKATFQRALNTWKESVGVNFIEGGTSTLQVVNADDGENIVMFDNGGTGMAALAAGVLATCYSSAKLCTGSGNNQVLKSGFDIVIRNTGYSSGSTAFTFGPCPPYSLTSNAVDLESVLLHELGHAINLGHIVDKVQGSGAGTLNPAKVMHYSVSMNQRRISLDYAAKLGAEYQVNTPDDSRTYGNCMPNPGNPAMIPLAVTLESKDDCPVDFPTKTTPKDTTVNFDLARSTSNKFVDPGFTQTTLNGTGTNITNTAYFALKTNNTGGDLSIKVTNYATTPAEISACSVGSAGIDVTGVKLSIYKTSSCPDGGSYPAPVFYNVFSGNATLPKLSGLEAGTNYLLVVDGLQNTKAAFDLTFSGSSILERVTKLKGEVFNTYNQLNWTTDTVFGIQSMALQRSSDGTAYQEISNVVGDDQETGEYKDDEPLPGNNYYRLAIKNTDGSVEYTDVVLLTRIDKFSVKVVSNLDNSSELVLVIHNNAPQAYGFVLQNALGQVVLRKQAAVAGGVQRVSFPVSLLQKGIYYMSVFDKNNKRLQSVTVSKLR